MGALEVTCEDFHLEHRVRDIDFAEPWNLPCCFLIIMNPDTWYVQ